MGLSTKLGSPWPPRESCTHGCSECRLPTPSKMEKNPGLSRGIFIHFPQGVRRKHHNTQAVFPLNWSHLSSVTRCWLALGIQIALNCSEVRTKFLHAGSGHSRWRPPRYEERAPLSAGSSSQWKRFALLKIPSLLWGRIWLNTDGVYEIWI